MSSTLRSSILLCFAFFLFTCSDKESTPRQYSRLRTLPVSGITVTGATLKGEVFFYSEEGIIDHGFVWGTSPYTTLTSGSRKSLGPKSDKGAFSAQISAGLANGTTYYAKAYLITKNHTVYGQPVTFESKGGLAPVIESFSPAMATFNDTISITGANFSNYWLNNSVMLANTLCGIIEAEETTLKVIVPANLSQATAPFVLRLAGYTATSAAEFRLLPPVVFDFTPAAGNPGTRVIINGKNFNPFVSYNSVRFGDITASVITALPTRLEVEVPRGLPAGNTKIRVAVAGQTTITASDFEIVFP
jgi:hypothetical protein